ncbi:hypothetical protein F4553_005123 [Allocatelliglobosispora scoriae]|uniref:Uncharacterized protein n=1 Tax=Allocatelliglobosispora scoriae TaxID=643052 RepID=A0A841BU66_9ACTN|nr:hypothetical protein [Allocatelliglobosispora scoriae]MBB5871744.1 hypothetical protein [Allocatelliglobosispora scoriae]
MPDRAQGATAKDAKTGGGTTAKRGPADPPTSVENQNPGGGGALTRVTANFTPRAIQALDRIAAKTGDSKTDILNRSVMVFDVILELIERSGDDTMTVVFPDGVQERIRLVG